MKNWISVAGMTTQEVFSVTENLLGARKAESLNTSVSSG